MGVSEIPVTIAVEASGLVLEGLWRPGTVAGGVIAPPHPEYGGSLDNPVVTELAFALEAAGCASLRFNWRGVGASQGFVTGDWQAADADFAAALDQLEASLSGTLLGVGYSFGAATAMRCALRDSRLSRLLLVAPPASMLRKLPLERFPGALSVIVGDEDEFAPDAELSELFGDLPNAELHVISGVDHFFGGSGLRDLAQLARSALG